MTTPQVVKLIFLIGSIYGMDELGHRGRLDLKPRRTSDAAYGLPLAPLRSGRRISRSIEHHVLTPTTSSAPDTVSCIGSRPDVCCQRPYVTFRDEMDKRFLHVRDGDWGDRCNSILLFGCAAGRTKRLRPTRAPWHAGREQGCIPS